MLNRNYLIAIALLLISINYSSCAQDNKVLNLRQQINYLAEGKKLFSDKTNVNFKVHVKMFENDIIQRDKTYFVYLSRKKKDNYIVVIDTNSLTSYKITNKYLLKIDEKNREYSVFLENKNDNLIWLNNIGHDVINRYFEFFPYYINFIKKPFKYHPIAVADAFDTVIKNTPYKIFESYTPQIFYYNKETDKFDIPAYKFKVKSWLDKNLKIIDSVCATSVEGSSKKIKYFYKINDFNYEDKSKFLEDVLSENSIKYKDYSFHTELKPPYSMIGIKKTNEKVSEFLDFPIIKVNSNDTLTINNMPKEWILVDFWFFGCEACYKNFVKLRKDNDSLNYNILEKNKIKLMAINAHSDNKNLIKERMKEYNIEGFLYSAKRINQVIHIPSFPYYLLISPEKKIIKRFNHLSNYDEIIKEIHKLENIFNY